MASKGEVEVRAVCPDCEGDGWVAGGPECCGRGVPDRHGDQECCGNPEPSQDACQRCESSGRVPVTLDAEAVREVVEAATKAAARPFAVLIRDEQGKGHYFAPEAFVAALCPSPEATDGK